MAAAAPCAGSPSADAGRRRCQRDLRSSRVLGELRARRTGRTRRWTPPTQAGGRTRRCRAATREPTTCRSSASPARQDVWTSSIRTCRTTVATRAWTSQWPLYTGGRVEALAGAARAEAVRRDANSVPRAPICGSTSLAPTGRSSTARESGRVVRRVGGAGSRRTWRTRGRSSTPGSFRPATSRLPKRSARCSRRCSSRPRTRRASRPHARPADRASTRTRPSSRPSSVDVAPAVGLDPAATRRGGAPDARGPARARRPNRRRGLATVGRRRARTQALGRGRGRIRLRAPEHPDLPACRRVEGLLGRQRERGLEPVRRRAGQRRRGGRGGRGAGAARAARGVRRVELRSRCAIAGSTSSRAARERSRRTPPLPARGGPARRRRIATRPAWRRAPRCSMRRSALLDARAAANAGAGRDAAGRSGIGTGDSDRTN